MQDYKDNELLKTAFLDNMKDQPELTEGATHRIIGYIPKKDDIIPVNGLSFKVVSSDNLKGRFVAQILKS